MPEEHRPSTTPADPLLDLTRSTPPPAPSPGNSLFFGPDGLRAGWSLVVFFLLVGILSLPTIPIFRHQLAHQAAAAHTTGAPHPATIQAPQTLTQDGLLFAVLLLASFLISRIERRPLSAYGIGRTPGALRHLLTGLAWGALFLSLLVLALKAAHLLVFDGRLLHGADILRFAAEWAVVFLFVALFEEYFLRGYLQFTLSRGLSGIIGAISPTPLHDTLGFWIAAVLLSFVFGLSHSANPGESPIGLLTAGCVALVFAFSLWRTGSLWWAIGFHAAWDWAQSYLYGVADSGIMMQGHLLASHPLGRPNLSGGLTGPEGSIFVVPILALVAVIIWITLPQIPRPVPIARLHPAPGTAALTPSHPTSVSPP